MVNHVGEYCAVEKSGQAVGKRHFPGTVSKLLFLWELLFLGTVFFCPHGITFQMFPSFVKQAEFHSLACILIFAYLLVGQKRSPEPSFR